MIFRSPIFVAVLMCFIVSCGGNLRKTTETPDKPVTVMDSARLLPQPKFDEELAQYLPYKRVPNPYLELSGKIKKEAVAAFIEAKRALKDNNYEESARLLTSVTEIEPELSGPWVMRGEIDERQGDRDAAMKHYRQAISVNKKNINAYLKLAKLQREAGEFVAAQNTYSHALKVWPDFPEAHLNIGVIYDIYLNKPVLAQKHIEAYLFLASEPVTKAKKWHSEIQGRTGEAISPWLDQHLNPKQPSVGGSNEE